MRHFSSALRPAVGLLALLFVPFGCRTAPSRASLADAGPVEFAEAKIILEQNVTDQDAEVVIVAKGLDEGLERLKVFNESGVAILEVTADASSLGVREFAVESPEPGLKEVLSAYPEGRYRLEGVTLGGVRLESVVLLSHALPEPPAIRVDKELGSIRWSAVAGAVRYVLELDREENDKDVMKLTVEIPAGVTSFQIPRSLREPGDYQAGVAAISETGNITVVEKTFTLEK